MPYPNDSYSEPDEPGGGYNDDDRMAPITRICVCGHLYGEHGGFHADETPHCLVCGCESYRPGPMALRQCEHVWNQNPGGMYCHKCGLSIPAGSARNG